jgi:hypothetical protein
VWFDLAQELAPDDTVETVDAVVMWVMMGAAFLAAVISIPVLVRHRGRGPAIEKAARAAGLRYQEQDGPGLGRLRFDLLVPNNGLNWNASHVVTSDRRGAAAHAFDIRVWTEVEVQERDTLGRSSMFSPSADPASTKTVRQTRAKAASGCIVTLPINAPRVMIVKENLASKLLVAAARVDLDVESDFFNRRYHVLTSDKGFAQALLNAQVLDLIVQGEGKMEFEFLGTKLLIRAPELEPELMPGLVSYGERFPDAISALVRDRYRDASAFDG